MLYDRAAAEANSGASMRMAMISIVHQKPLGGIETPSSVQAFMTEILESNGSASASV